MNTKNNIRYQVNDRAIEEALLALLENKTTEEITIRDICELSGINRSTFYRHYMDIYDLLDHVQDHVFMEWFEQLPVNEIKPDPASLSSWSNESMKLLLLHIKKYPNFYRNYLARNNEAFFGSETEHIWNGFFIPFFNNLGVTDEVQMKYYFSFYRSGVTDMIRTWLKNDCKDDISILLNTIKAFDGVQRL